MKLESMEKLDSGCLKPFFSVSSLYVDFDNLLTRPAKVIICISRATCKQHFFFYFFLNVKNGGTLRQFHSQFHPVIS